MNTNMSISDVREKKAKLEQEITTLILEKVEAFRKETGVTVEDIRIDWIDTTKPSDPWIGYSRRIGGVCIPIRMEL